MTSDQRNRTVALQGQFICPIWAVWVASVEKEKKLSVSIFFTNYHAEQMMRALRLNGTPCACYDGKGAEL